MEAITLDDFMSLNDQLAALIRADVPVDLGLPESPDAAAAELERINAVVARRVSRGEPLAEAIESESTNLPRQYRSVVEMGLRNGDMLAALDDSSQLAESVRETRHDVRAAFFYPLLVGCLAVVGLAFFCWLLVPTLVEVDEGFRIPEGDALEFLQILRPWIPAIGWVFAALVALAVALRLLGKSGNGFGFGVLGRLLGKITGAARADAQERLATFASSLASLLASGASLDDALPVAAGASGDAGLNAAAARLVGALASGKDAAQDASIARRFPPFLRWALLEAEPTIDRPRALRMAADVYRQSGARYAQRSKIAAPILTVVFLGGGAVLLYALALFLPLLHMLYGLASPS